MKPDARKIISLLESVRAAENLSMIQIDHANVSSIAQLGDGELREINRLLKVSPRHQMVWVNLGVETASSELLAANGLSAKVAPFALADWSELVDESIRRLLAAGFVPMASLIMGLPGETQEHVQQTLELVKKWRGLPIVVFPIFNVAVSAGVKSFRRADMTPLHWELFAACYDFNFRYVPPLLGDNHRAAAAP